MTELDPPRFARFAPLVAPLVAALIACAGPAPKAGARASLLEPAQPVERGLSPAEWRYHPRKPARLVQSYALGGGQRLFVGALGERWLAEGGRATPASSLAPETLVGALAPSDDAGWVFIGRSGSAYRADSPLGALLTSSTPRERLARVAVARTSLIGISAEAHLLVSDEAGLSWKAVGPDGARFAEVLSASPHALALEVPERLWWSGDDGLHWQPLATEPFGAERLVTDAEAGPVVTSALGARVVDLRDRAGAPPALAPLGRVPRLAEPDLNAAPLEGPSARAIVRGRAFSRHGRYFEVELGALAEVSSGDFTGRLASRRTPLFSACHDIEVAGFGAWVYAACTRERVGSARQFEFFRSEDHGQSFTREAYTARGDVEHVALAVGDGGVLIATGFCPRDENLPGCRPRGIQMRRAGDADGGVEHDLFPVPASALEDSALALTFSHDGKRAYAVGQRTKGDALFAFVAEDLQAGFSAHPIARTEDGDLTGPLGVSSFAAAPDGHVSLVLSGASGAARLVLLDAAGRTLASNPPPIPSASIGAHGTRALAVASDEVWESLDGGQHWESVGRAPNVSCSGGATRCAIPIACERDACAISDNVTRVGWGGQSRESLPLMPPLMPPRGGRERAVAEAWSCDLAHSEWEPLAGVERLPDASQAALGKAAWFALATQDTTASAGLWLADVQRPGLGRAREVRYSELLAPSERSAELAYHASLQVEGAAALRYAIPGDARRSSTDLAHVEVAWENLLEQRRGNAVIADAGPAQPGDFNKSEGPARRAHPDLLSITSGGIYVRVHSAAQAQQPSYFLDGRAIEEVPRVAWPNPLPKGSGMEIVRIGGEHVPLSFLNQSATVVRARWRGGRWQHDAMSLGFTDPEGFDLRQARDISYIRSRPGIHWATRHGGQSDAFVFPLQAEGPVFGAALRVPTQLALSERPQPCTARQRSETPRVVAPREPGRRHPVLVHDPVEPLRVLLTDSAVLHGTVESPCAAAFDAELVKTPGTPGNARERALLSLDGPSWLFRGSPEGGRRETRVEYRAMTCRPDPGAELPPELFELPGTHSDG